MAKTHALVRHHTFGRPAAPVVIVRPSRRARARRAVRVVAGGARRAARRGVQHLPLIGTAAAAGAIGYLESQKKLSFIPAIVGSRAATIGIAGFIATRFFKNPTVRMVGAAAVIAAAFDVGRVKGGGVSGFEDDGGGGPGSGV